MTANKCLYCGHLLGYAGFREEFMKFKDEQNFWTNKELRDRMPNTHAPQIREFLLRLAKEGYLIAHKRRGTNITHWGVIEKKDEV